MPDEPTNGSARTRRRHGLPPRASALVLLAFSLFVLSGIVYVQSIPSLLPAPEQSAPAGEQGEPGSEGHGDVNQGQSGSGAGAADQGSSRSGDKGGEQPQEGDLQGASVEGAHAQGEPSDHSASDAGPDAPAAGSDESPAADDSSEPPSSNDSAPPAGNSGQGKSYLLKFLLCNMLESGKSVLSLDSEHEMEALCGSLGGSFVDLLSGRIRINLLEPRHWDDGSEPDDPDAPDAFRGTLLAQHISFLRDIFRVYKEFDTPTSTPWS